MAVLVTGGAGYIGSHTLVEVLKAGHEAHVVDNLANARPAALARVKQLANRDFAAAFVFDALVIVPRHRMQTGLRLGRTRGERQAYLREVIALIFEGLAPRSGHRPLP